MITCPNTVKYSDNGATATIDLRTLASLIPADRGDTFYFPITIPRHTVPEPESESESDDDEPEIPKAELKTLYATLADLSFDLDCLATKVKKVWNQVEEILDADSSSCSSCDSDYASSDENEKFISPVPSPPPLVRQMAIAISSDEEQELKDDLPLAPGRYKKQF